MVIDALLEGPTDEAVARKLVSACRHQIGTVYGRRGQEYVRDKIEGFNVRAKYGNPMLVLVDFMDTSLDCPPAVPSNWLPDCSDKLLLRVVVRELESWLLADTSGLARFLNLSSNVIPRDPENLRDPKRTLVHLARRSRLRRMREAIIPRPGVSSVTGPGYVAAIEEYVTKYEC